MEFVVIPPDTNAEQVFAKAFRRIHEQTGVMIELAGALEFTIEGGSGHVVQIGKALVFYVTTQN